MSLVPSREEISTLSAEDIEDLEIIVRSGRQHPAFYKDDFSMSPAAIHAARVLRRHGIQVHWNGDTGRATFDDEAPRER